MWFRSSAWTSGFPLGSCRFPEGYQLSGFDFQVSPWPSPFHRWFFLFPSPGSLVSSVSVRAFQEELSAIRLRLRLRVSPLPSTFPYPRRFLFRRSGSMAFPRCQIASRSASRASAPFPASGFPLGLLRFRFPGALRYSNTASGSFHFPSSVSQVWCPFFGSGFRVSPLPFPSPGQFSCSSVPACGFPLSFSCFTGWFLFSVHGCVLDPFVF